MTVRQSATPQPYDMTRRMDNASILTSFKAGVVNPIAFVPLHRGDSATGRFDCRAELAEMPRPVDNAIVLRMQTWCAPRPALPQFSGLDEYTHSYHGKDITALGSSNRTPPALFSTVGTGAISAAQSSDFFKVLGISLRSSTAINTDYIDTYNLVQNFRLAAHSSKMTRYDYYAENATNALALKRAFWPRSRMHDIVADYESALVTGAMELDVSAGQVALENIWMDKDSNVSGSKNLMDNTTDPATAGSDTAINARILYAKGSGSLGNATYDALAGTLAGQTITTTLADIDKARTTNAMAKAQAAYAGTNFSGFNNDDVIIADLMQGFRVPDELFNRPWLLDSKTVVFNQNERHATDAANLDDSVTTGGAAVSLSVNVPKMEYGGIIMLTAEVMPERLYERQKDEYLYCTDVDDLPNALRDIQRTEPVDTVKNDRIDVAHSTPDGTFGYEPMNAKWKREFTRLGGEFRQLTPGTPSTTARTAIWQADYVNPAYTSDHFLCPSPMNQAVFSVPANDICNLAVSQNITITGITQFGDALVEDNDEYLNVKAEDTL